jgi:hypothetical protein
MDNLEQFGFAFDAKLEEEEEYTSMDDVPGDPGVFLPNDEGRTEFLPPDADRVPRIKNAVKQDSPAYANRPADERTRELFTQMGPHRIALLGLLDEARTPSTIDQLDEAQRTLKGRKFSVYTTANLCAMLEVAGALKRVDAQAAPYAAATPQPDIVIIDGEEYYEPTTRARIWWQTTDAGNLMLDERNAAERLRTLFAREADFLPLYKRVLALASRAQGVDMAELSAQVDGNPIIAEPRRFFVQHFVESLERCEALTWIEPTWHISPVGQEGLAALSDVVDDYVAPERTAEPTDMLNTETQGVNW